MSRRAGREGQLQPSLRAQVTSRGTGCFPGRRSCSSQQRLQATPASASGILPEEQQLLQDTDCSCSPEFLTAVTKAQTGKNELLQSPVPSACLWQVRSSPSTQLRMPRTSPHLPPSQTLTTLRANTCQNNRNLFVLPQKTSPPAPRTCPGPLLPPYTTFHAAFIHPKISDCIWVKL